MTLDGSCLTEHALSLLVWGEATAEDSERALRHVDSCSACREIFERLAQASVSSAVLPLVASDGASGWVSLADPAWTPPEWIQEFRVVRRLGRGAMGDVWLARDTLLERDVALKFAGEAATHEARLRFDVEARAVARLQHPNILAVHHAGEIADRPFLVTELLRGRSLDRVGRLAPERVIAVGVDLARGLAAAHAAGVVHRDIKPANAFLCDDGVAKLLDFGLAQLSDQAASHEDAGIAGTPAYMAPETWCGEAATRPTDVYSLGALLFTLLADRPPYGGTTVQEIRAAVLAGHLPDLAAAAPGAPAPMVELVLRCLRSRREARPSAEEACNALQAMRDVGPETAMDELPSDPDASPYRGMLSFGLEQRGLFFGREVETTTVLTALHGAPFVLVVGPSGAGKSSLVRAGVQPRVAAGALGRGRWRATTMVPSERPVERLSQTLAPLKDGGDGVVLIVDQLEEAWTLAAEPERTKFFEELAALSEAGPKMRIVATLRSDFLSRLRDLGDLRAQALRAPVVLGAMSSEGLRRAIVEPARRRGVEVEPELVDRLAGAARGESGVLPLLGFALGMLWERRDRAARRITLAHLDALGGLEGALAAHADAALARMSAPLRAHARRLLLATVTVERTRARRDERALLDGSPGARPALEALVEARLLVASAGEETASAAYEVAHEALLSGWPALRGWLDQEAASRQALERARRAAAEWERLGRSSEALFGERRLDELDELGGRPLPPETQAFVAESRAAVRRTRLGRAALALGIPLALAITVGVAWRVTEARHRAAVGRALATARERDVAAEETARAAGAARAGAFALFEKDDLRPAEDLWKKMLALEEEADRQRRDVCAAVDEALALDPRDPAARALHADVTLARLVSAERLHNDPLLRELRPLLGLHDDGSRAAWLGAPAHVRVQSDPPGARLTLARYREDAARRLVETDRAPLEEGVTRELEAGSYVIVAEAPGRYGTRYPFVVRRGEERSLRVELPPTTIVPEGMVYVPAGRSQYGSGDDEVTRGVLMHQPIHDVEVGAFFIGRTEVTNADYLAFLRALPPAEREARMPDDLTLLDGRIAWRGREKLAPGVRYCNGVQPCVDWSELPVGGASRDDGEQLAAWLSRSGRVPGARLCTDREWERAARGADDRRYPAGNDLGPSEACTLATYGGSLDRAGPCVPGSHPASRSPFGVEDMTGNEMEWTSHSPDTARPAQAVLRGGGWDFSGTYVCIPNRGFLASDVRSVTSGLRICADAP
jgi:formylglycine-generating enzyme required for sulfatase activity